MVFILLIEIENLIRFIENRVAIEIIFQTEKSNSKIFEKNVIYQISCECISRICMYVMQANVFDNIIIRKLKKKIVYVRALVINKSFGL